MTAADPDTRPARRLDSPPPAPRPDEPPARFQPRVEAEEGDPDRGDYIIGLVVAVVVIAGFLWAFGVLSF